MSEFTEGNCGDCPEFRKYRYAAGFFQFEKTVSHAHARSIASTDESLKSLLAYTDELLSEDMDILFGTNHAEFYENVENSTCLRPRRPLRFLGFTKVCVNPSIDSLPPAEEI